MNNKTTYAYNKQMHDEAVERCQSNEELCNFALKLLNDLTTNKDTCNVALELFNDLTTNKDTWNYFVNFYNKQVIEYVTDMFNNDFFVYDGDDVECVVETLYELLDNWNKNWYKD